MTQSSEQALLLTVARILRSRLHEMAPAYQDDDKVALDEALAPFDPVDQEPVNEEAPSPTPAIDKAAPLIEILLQFATAAYEAMDNSESMDEGAHIFEPWWGSLCKTLDVLEALPDDRPGYTMSPPAKVRWALEKVGVFKDRALKAQWASDQLSLLVSGIDEALSALRQPGDG